MPDPSLKLTRWRAPGRSRQALERATLEWVHWLLQPPAVDGAMGCIPPAEAEANYHRTRAVLVQAA